MKRSRLRHDLNHLTSAGLLVVTVLAAATGVIAHVWDINDFVYHIYLGYALIGFAAAHVAFNWSRLVAYARFRLRNRSQPNRSQPNRSQPERSAPALPVERGRWSRRAFLGLALGGAGGFVAGRSFSTTPEIAHGSDLGVIYHEWSKPGTPSIWGTISDWGQQPPLYKTYTGARQIALPEPRHAPGLATEDAIRRRESARAYSHQPLTIDELSRLLWYTGGISHERWGHRMRTAPSSGALYPIETYVVAHNVADLSPGLYHYAVERHGLHELRLGDLRADVVRPGLMQEFLGAANIVIIFTSIFQRMRWKYQQRSYRYALLEAGHMGQNTYLAAISMGMGACAVGAFVDRDLNALLGVDGTEEAAVYMLAVGHV
jgi:SagB-type dehydrogenase family enzyme